MVTIMVVIQVNKIIIIINIGLAVIDFKSGLISSNMIGGLSVPCTAAEFFCEDFPG